jgi:hypothetical protein
MSTANALRANYKVLPITAWAGFFFACSVWLYAAPLTSGRMSGVLRTENGLTVLGGPHCLRQF